MNLAIPSIAKNNSRGQDQSVDKIYGVQVWVTLPAGLFDPDFVCCCQVTSTRTVRRSDGTLGQVTEQRKEKVPIGQENNLKETLKVMV